MTDSPPATSAPAPPIPLSLRPPPTLRCPRCGRADLTLEPRRGTLDRIAALVFWRPLACRGCRRRFRRFVPRSELDRLRRASAA
ncbi:MAG TPA: hypothetical protein VKW76_08350 [Candidatus Binatia bacterium]|nr:hypothetical protein [Candidatus Binatia bacterium]